jgi:hypothetical protein
MCFLLLWLRSGDASSCAKSRRLERLERLEHLERLERLERPECLECLWSRDRLEHRDRLDRLERLERLERRERRDRRERLARENVVMRRSGSARVPAPGFASTLAPPARSPGCVRPPPSFSPARRQ